MADTAPEKTDEAPLTGVRSLADVIRHLITHGPARNEAERAELAAAVNAADPDYEEPPHVMTDGEKAAEYDRLQAASEKAAPPATRAAAAKPPAGKESS